MWNVENIANFIKTSINYGICYYICKKKCILLFFMKKKYILKYISKVTFKNIL